MDGIDVRAIFLVLAGGFTLVAAFADWDWFMGHRKARFFVRALGRGGARIFYGLLGAALTGVGVAGLLGMIPSS